MVLRSMMKLVLGCSFALALGGCPDEGKTSATADGKTTATAAADDTRCEHGVKKELCARCTPALAAAFKAKNDWCAEHERPESQCLLCHPDLAKQGIK